MVDSLSSLPFSVNQYHLILGITGSKDFFPGMIKRNQLKIRRSLIELDFRGEENVVRTATLVFAGCERSSRHGGVAVAGVMISRITKSAWSYRYQCIKPLLINSLLSNCLATGLNIETEPRIIEVVRGARGLAPGVDELDWQSFSDGYVIRADSSPMGNLDFADVVFLTINCPQ